MKKSMIRRAVPALAGAALAVVALFPSPSAADEPQPGPVLAPATVLPGTPIDGIGSGSMEEHVFHIHAHLAIYVDGVLKWLPHGIGVVGPLVLDPAREDPFITAAQAFYWLHTHDESGVIHMEAPKPRDFVLGEFFDLWRQPLSLGQVGPALGPVTVLVDGHSFTGDPRTIPLTAHTVIQLDVGTVVPFQPFDFPAGY
jgi:hypothetical protein